MTQHSIWGFCCLFGWVRIALEPFHVPPNVYFTRGVDDNYSSQRLLLWLNFRLDPIKPYKIRVKAFNAKGLKHKMRFQWLVSESDFYGVIVAFW